MTSRSTGLHLCVICGDKKVTVNGRSETGKKLITNLLRCLSVLHELKSNAEKLENVNLCFKCKYAVEEWTSAQNEATGSGFLANRARQIKASFLVKILESAHKSPVSSPLSASERIRQLIYNRFNVAVNVDRLELSCEPIHRVSQQEWHQNPTDSEESDASECQDDLDTPSAESSDVELLEDERDQVEEILPTKPRIFISSNIFESDDNQGEGHVVNHREFAPSVSVPTQSVREVLKWKLELRKEANRKTYGKQSNVQPEQQVRRANQQISHILESRRTYSKKSTEVSSNKSTEKCLDLEQAEVDGEESENESIQVDDQDNITDPVENFQKKHPVPPDFIPDKQKPGSYVYGKCNAMESENEAKCCECSFSVPVGTDDDELSSWWKIRDHMRNEHPALVPCIAPTKELQVKCIGEDKFQYGEATITKFMELDVECYKCDVCGETYRSTFARKCCMDHIRRSHPDVALFNPFCTEKAVFVKENLIRYAAAYLKKVSDTKVICQVCSFVSKGKCVQKSAILHVRNRHAVLAPVETSAITQTNLLQILSSSKKEKANSNTANVGQEAVDEESVQEPVKQADQNDLILVENFQRNHPIPPDFIPDKHKPGNYLYGKCNGMQAENGAKCCECSFSVPLDTGDGMSSWWKLREHMRNEHSRLVPCVAPAKELQMKCIGEDKFQYGEATITKFMELDAECYKCDVCNETFRRKFGKKCCMSHIRRSHPEVALFNPYWHEKPVFVKKNIIRYGAAYLKKLSDTEVICQVCPFVSNGKFAQKSILQHVRKRHSVLAPVEISATTQTNPPQRKDRSKKEKANNTASSCQEAVDKELADEPNELVGQNGMELVENFLINHPIPPDFIPDDTNSASYHYGKCSIIVEVEKEVKCSECSFVVPMLEAEGVSCWWKIRQHMRELHPEKVGVQRKSVLPDNPSQQTIKRSYCGPTQVLRKDNMHTKDSPTRPKRKCAAESLTKNTEDGNGSGCDEESSASSSSDESDDPAEGRFVPNPFWSFGFECPLCGDRRREKENFIVHLKWHAGRVDEDSPRQC